ncbi:sugar nucleotide-binding protein [Candidatus Methylopumilus planktonicus]|uniref:sugar nucleotide-binding protein n=1 Tax=Candidatus Methylopumilus planktonicus TaxID=1581557 RepID=UPI001123C2A1|nr:sugar nucleotide-binding protein [Candidatus Methylopumilus planktonicus]QDD00107.1 NAD-dependent epimerase/dehydratase family protein [Candidatus Methylopumilus planktonicus]
MEIKSLKVLIIGCGQLGFSIVNNADPDVFKLYGFSRSLRKSPASIEMHQVDILKTEAIDAIKLINPEIIIYAVSADTQSIESYQDHYVLGLKKTYEAILELDHFKHLFFVSSTRVYGQKTTKILSELDIAEPSDYGGEALMEAETVARQLKDKATILRLSGIYGPNRKRMIQLAQSNPGNWPATNNWSNRIHEEDAARFIVFLMKRIMMNESIEPLYLVTDGVPTKQYDVLTWIRNRLQLTTDTIELPILESGKQLQSVLLNQTGFVLKYPDFTYGYEAIID